MRPILALIFSLFIYSFQQVNPNEELKIKADKVRARLIIGEPLPKSIKNLDGLAYPEQDSLKHDFQFRTVRIQNNISDSVDILLTIFDDSLLHFYFAEDHYMNDVFGESYAYEINKYGIIDYAYRQESREAESPDTANPTPNEWVIFTPKFQPVFEIDFDSRDSILKNPNKKIVDLYNERLKISIDELYHVLFKQ